MLNDIVSFKNQMKKIIYFVSLTLFFATACEKSAEIVTNEKLLVSIVYAYSMSNTVGEASVAISQNSSNADEIGVVWATKSNPTTTDNRESIRRIDNVQSYPLKMNNLTQGTTYYIKAYYTFQGVTTYGSDEITFTQNYDPNWFHVSSPVINPDQYVLASGGQFSGSGGGIVYYSVNKNTNIAKTIFFYPGVDDWQLRYYNSDISKDAPMRFEPFRANYIIKTVDKTIPATLAGGGYYKQANGKKFFLKDFRIEGVSGYTFQPSYPGTDATTSSFGLDGNGYVLENISQGTLWRYATKNFQWEALNTVPVAKEAKFIPFETADRVFILPESNDWNDDLDAFYEYLPATNQWKAITTFKGENRRRGVAFTHNRKLYYGAGQSTKTRRGLRDIWEYNPTTNVWKQIGNYPGAGTVNLIPLMVGNVLYIGFGQQAIPNENQAETFNDVADFWRFTIR